MKYIKYTIMAIAISMSGGCMYMPCAWQSAEACADGGDEGGGSEPEELTVLEFSSPGINFTGRFPVAVDGDARDWTWILLQNGFWTGPEDTTGLTMLVNPDDCTVSSEPWECRRWWDYPAVGDQCRFCYPMDFGIGVSDPPLVLQGSARAMCPTADKQVHRYGLAGIKASTGEAACEGGSDPIGSCTPIQFNDGAHPLTGIYSAGDDDSTGYTCRCDSDSDCLAGDVCQAGFEWEGGLNGHLKPTLCTWDVGASDVNGAMPDGPASYGLARFEDGFTITGSSSVLITEYAAKRALHGAVNDNQVIDIAIDTDAGELVASVDVCNAGALCGYLGIAEGSTIVVELEDVIGSVVTGGLAVDVYDPDGTRTEWSVEIEIE